MPKRVLTEEHLRKLALGREKALANRRAKAKAKKVQKELDALELRKMRDDQAKKLASLKAEPKPTVAEKPVVSEKPVVAEKPEKTVEQAAVTQPSPNQLAVDNVAVPKTKKTNRKKRKKRVVVLESDSESDDEEIVVVRAPRRKRRAPSPHPRPRSQPIPIPQPKPQPKPRQPSREELEARARKRRQDFLTSVMGDRWR
jgi:hypothetical protein